MNRALLSADSTLGYSTIVDSLVEDYRVGVRANRQGSGGTGTLDAGSGPALPDSTSSSVSSSTPEGWLGTGGRGGLSYNPQPGRYVIFRTVMPQSASLRLEVQAIGSVPEPVPLLLVGMALVGIGFKRVHRR